MMRYLAVGIALIALTLTAADWPRFRGPEGAGIAADRGVPDKWDSKDQIVWRTELPGPGASSPIILGDKVFLTCFSGYGLSEDSPGQQEALEHHLVAIDRSNGRILWTKAEKALMPETEFRGFVALHGYASSTPATDGEAVYAFFGRSGVYAFSVAGEKLWQADVGEGRHGWGSATSPILAGDLVIVNASVESNAVVALAKKTGKEVWRVAGIEKSWSTPALVELPGGKRELVISSFGKVTGVDPVTGQTLWTCAGVDDYVCAAVIAHEGIAYVSGGRKDVTLAVKAGGRGDVTATHLLWKQNKGSKVGTPLYHEGHLYWLDNAGRAVCLKADSGEVVYQERLDLSGRGDKAYASLVYADGKLFGVTRLSGTVVLDANPAFLELSRNTLDDSSVFNGTPAVADGRLLLRSDRYLYCIGTK
jgi:outer membrane protein assembly factor BamB